MTAVRGLAIEERNLPTGPVEDRGSRVSRCLEDVWGRLRGLHGEIPEAVMVTISAGVRHRLRGYFACRTWRANAGESKAHEIGINPDLFAEPAEVLCTLLHEAAHSIVFGRGIVEGRYYHPKEFRDVCVDELELPCGFWNRRYGFTLTQWPESGVPKRYADVMGYLKENLPPGTGAPESRGRRTPRPLPVSGHTRLRCRCQDRSVYVNARVVKKGGVVCTFCKGPFLPVSRESQDSTRRVEGIAAERLRLI